MVDEVDDKGLVVDGLDLVVVEAAELGFVLTGVVEKVEDGEALEWR